MATVRRNFSVNQGLVAENSDIEIKNGNSLKINDDSNNAITITAPTAVDSAFTLTLPMNDGNANDVLQTNGSGVLTFASLGDLGGGSVTSVALSAPTGLTVSGSPITSSGTIALALDTGYVIPLQSTLNGFATQTGTETLTNKTLPQAVLTNPIISGNTVFSDDSSAHDFDIGSHNGTNGLKLGGTLVSSTAAELNLLDGSSAGTVTNGKAVIYGSAGELAVGASKLAIGGVTVTSTAAELNILDGVTADANELNILDGVTASTSELNILDGVTSTTAELNKLDGYTGSVTELNYLKSLYDTGVTSAEYDFLDGVTSNIQTQLNGKLSSETTTSIQITNTGGDPRNIVYTDEEGNDTTLDLRALVRAQETVTSLALAANILTYTDEAGTDTDIDLSIYVDDSNLARITSGTVDDAGIATFTRDDNTTFDISFAGLFDGYGLTVVGDDSSGHKFLSGNTMVITGGTNVTTSVDNATGEVTINGPDLTNYLLTSNQFLNATNNASKTAGSLTLADNVDIKFGTGGGDSDISHDGSNFIVDVTTGNVQFKQANDFEILNAGGSSTAFKVDTDGETSLRHNFVEKLKTTSAGITVSGSVTNDASVTETLSNDSVTSYNVDFTGFGAELLIMIEDTTDTTKHQVSKVLATHDGTDVYITEYGATWSDSELISSISGSVASNTVTITINTTASSDISVHTVSLA